MSTVEAGRAARGQASPVSLVDAATAALRRVLAGIAAANGVPSLATHGHDTRAAKTLHLVLVSSVGVSFDARLWCYDGASEQWALHPTLGAVTVTTAGGVTLKLVDINQCERVYVEALNLVGGGEVCEAWASGT